MPTAGAILIRPCRVRDVRAVLALWRLGEAAPSVTDNVVALRRRLKRDRQLFLLAWDGPTLVGSIIGGWDGWRASVARLTVDPLHRRQGIATALVTRVEQELRKLGATRTGFVVLEDNRRARAFWRKAGYRLQAGSLRYVKDLGPGGHV